MNFETAARVRFLRLRFGPLVFPLLVLFLIPAGRLPAANEIGYVEKFALAADREAALAELIPGTEDYYYYHALHLQNQGKRAEFKALLDQWRARFKESVPRQQFENRQILIDYDVDPKGTLEYIGAHTGVLNNHEREVETAKPNLPTTLDPATVGTAAFLAANTVNEDLIKNLSARALEDLIRSGAKLSRAQRREALAKLTRPDVPQLVAMINAEMGEESSPGFGEFPIHNQLTLAQLDEIAKLRPGVRGSSAYVNAYLTKLAPGADTDADLDPVEREAWLVREWEFVKKLNDSFNSLKAHILYQRLDHARHQGRYPADLFGEYVKLPREVPYFSQKFWEKNPLAHERAAKLDADFAAATACPPVRSDEELVRDYLLHLLAAAENPNAFAPWLDEAWLKAVFAEAKLLAGVGDAEKWSSLIAPAAFEALKNRVDLQFDLANPRLFGPADEVALDVHVKNVGKLAVKIFELNPESYHETRLEPITTDIDLDGLVAGAEQTYAYNEAPLHRVKRTFKFPEIAKTRGVWVIEFIGNGRSSRALIRKGGLQYVTRSSTAGHVLTVLDEERKPVAGAFATLKGQRYEADTKTAEILIPFTNTPGPQPVVLHDGAGFAALEMIPLEAETYALEAGFYIDRESLLAGKMARLAVRPVLRLNGAILTAELLTDPKLVITSTTLDGITTTATIDPFKLGDNGESIHELNVPDRLAKLHCELSGKVKSLSQGNDVPLSAAFDFGVNEFDRIDQISDLHVGKADGAYFLEERGRNGELKPERALFFTFVNADYTLPVNVSLKTDANGRVVLGPLAGIARFTVKNPNGLTREVVLRGDRLSAGSTVDAKAGGVIRVPVVHALPADKISAGLSLLETRNGTFVRDWVAAASFKDGFVEIKDLPPGDYALTIREESRTVAIRVTAGVAMRNFLVAPSRMLELTPPQPMHLASAGVEGGEFVIRIANPDALSRVHVAATRYVPAFDMFTLLGGFRAPEPRTGRPARAVSQFLSGRDLGDELRYIMDRRTAKHFAGQMLERPGLLLNPWAVRDTNTDTQQAKAGDLFERLAEQAGTVMKPQEAPAKSDLAGPGAADPRDIDWLALPGAVTYNVPVPKDGVLKLKLAELGDATQVHVLALNPATAIYREVSLPAKPIPTRDLRLASGLDPQKHFARQDEITVLEKDKPFTIADALTARFETYDHLGRAWTLLNTLGKNPAFAEFAFILEWPKFDEKKKRELYSKYACHELSFFLARKDPDFFAKVILPYLRNKKDKTFVDEYLTRADLTRFLEPWRHGQLNIVERILLGRRLKDESSAEARAVRDLLETLPPNREAERVQLETALVSFSLDDMAAESADHSGIRQGCKELGEALQQLDGIRNKNDATIRERFGRELHDSDKKSNADAFAPPAPDAADAAQRGDQLGNAKGEGKFFKSTLGAQAEVTMHGTPRMNFWYGYDRANNENFLRGAARPDITRDFDTGVALAPDGAFIGRFDDGLIGGITADSRLRGLAAAQQFFRKLEATKEWAENNYWHLLIGDQNASLIPVNRYWADYAAWNRQGAFVSTHLAEAGRNFAEMMLALAVLDLPFPSDAKEVGAKVEGITLTLTPHTPVILYHQEIKPTEVDNAGPKLLVSQNFYRHGDRYVEANGEKTDKFVTDEFLTGVLYGCQVVVTNPTSSTQKLDVLFQIPRGALPAAGSKATQSQPARLEAFHTQTFDMVFYFPKAGAFPQFPVHVAREGKVVAFAAPFDFKVVDQLTKPDTASWAYVSQHGTAAEVLSFLDQHNLLALDLDKIAWRLRESGDFFKQVIERLAARRVYHATSYAYGLRHNDPVAVREFVRHEGTFLAACGAEYWPGCRLIPVDPVERRTYEHLEYSPLVNARSQKLGAERTILNDRFRGQYQRFLTVLANKPALDDTDRLATACYLLLQDRTEDALAFFGQVKREAIATALQYDYAAAWLALAQEDTKTARAIVAKYAEHPVDKWREKFAQLTAQLDEIDGRDPKVTKDDDRNQTQDALAAKQPAFDFKIEGTEIKLDAKNLPEVTVNYYLMDLEFLFSTNPFVGQNSARFAQIKPNKTEVVKLDAKPEAAQPASPTIPLPREFQNKNVLVEIVAAGRRKSQAVYANDLKIVLSEAYGQLQVRHAKDERPLARVYVKVYADVNGHPSFYKDGYTDLRGKFDYATLSTGQIDQTRRFSILILSDDHGAIVKEAKPPMR